MSETETKKRSKHRVIQLGRYGRRHINDTKQPTNDQPDDYQMDR